MKTKYSLLLIILLFFTGCEKVLFDEAPKNNPEDLFEDLWNSFNTDYAPFDERGVNWQEQYEIFRPRVNPETSNEELLNIFKQMLRSLDDAHVSIATPDSKVWYANRIIDEEIDDDLYNPDVIKNNYLKNQFITSGDGGNLFGWIGDIGYVHFGRTGDNMLYLNTILDYFKSARGLIVDLRHNTGGNFTYAFSEFGRFTKEEILVFQSKTKNGPGENDYTAWYDWYIYPSGDYFDKPLVLLTDRYTISAGERMAMAFKSLPNLIHIGEPTSGAFATKIGKELANGWNYTLVTQKIIFRDGISYEGKGMIPDVMLKNAAEEINAGTDKVLETALQTVQQ